MPQWKNLSIASKKVKSFYGILSVYGILLKASHWLIIRCRVQDHSHKMWQCCDIWRGVRGGGRGGGALMVTLSLCQLLLVKDWKTANTSSALCHHLKYLLTFMKKELTGAIWMVCVLNYEATQSDLGCLCSKLSDNTGAIWVVCVLNYQTTQSYLGCLCSKLSDNTGAIRLSVF